MMNELKRREQDGEIGKTREIDKIQRKREIERARGRRSRERRKERKTERKKRNERGQESVRLLPLSPGGSVHVHVVHVGGGVFKYHVCGFLVKSDTDYF